MVPILDRNNKILRHIAKEVPLSDIGSPRIQAILADMKEALASQDDGIAIAAPQIGQSYRIFVVSGKVMNIVKKEKDEEERHYPDQVYINPVITKLSKKKEKMEEGCLSVRYLYGKCSRSTKATIVAYDENGNKFTRGVSGLMAQVFQHETDHLNGILFVDTATDLEELDEKEVKERTRKS